MPAAYQPGLFDSLPEVRGVITSDADIARTTWFRVGGRAEILFEPADIDDLAQFLSSIDPSFPVTVLGAGSNIIIRDGGISGITIRLGRSFSDISMAEEAASLEAGAGAIDVTVSRAARNAGIGGLEFLSGIPGTIGGAVRMNAGAYEHELADVIIETTAVSRSGEIVTLPRDEMKFAHRFNSAPEDLIFCSARLQGVTDDPDTIRDRMAEIAAAREASQPIRMRTGGSTFKNPPGLKAWELIDTAGCRGLRRGGAQVSPMHCNFLINTGLATAADLEGLGEDVRARVLDRHGVSLEWEIRRVGDPLPAEAGRRQ